MARRAEDTQLHRRFRSLLSPQRIALAARETGFVQRKGKINPFKLVWTLALGFACGRDRTVAGLRRAYERLAGTTIAPSSFYDRFGAPLVALLQLLIRHLLDTTFIAGASLAGSLRGFADVVVADASIIRLRELLERHFPACRTNHTKAAAKLHVVMSATGLSSRTVSITSERINDRCELRIGSWVKDRLLLFDLGYYGFRLFDRIDRNKGFFVTRLKSSSNPLIVSSHLKWRGRAVPVVGKRLGVALKQLRRAVLDVDVEVQFKRRPYNGRASTARRRFRVIAIRNDKTGEYHTYLTNVPPDRLSAEDIALAYRARWQIELMFKACKSEFRLDDVESRKKEVVEALIYASILTMLITQRLLGFIRSKLAEDVARRVTLGRAAAALHAFAADLLRAIVHSQATPEWRAIEALLVREAIDPHITRPQLLEAAAGIGGECR